MPGPNSTPNPSRKRETAQTVPPKLAARLADWEQNKQPSGHHKPGSQKK